MRTNLKVVDNSGAKRVMCIQALKGKKGARLGDTIIASVKEAQPGGKVKKGAVVYGVVVRAAMQRGRCDGSEVKFDDNAVVLVNKQGEPIGTRVFGPVPHELRKKKHVKILSLAEHDASQKMLILTNKLLVLSTATGDASTYCLLVSVFYAEEYCMDEKLSRGFLLP
ncbi:hypothetical protein RJ640_004180 [Escallonia rubra]|uniref:50S ribosomal protein L14, chloroplastic n=1 Tax=Escallonia rubra TaxID=112253 RepID=A0AA88RKC1_9ASTE|nr:hypothetical protein RJ640_004180 [Escallonia rubra]